MRAPIIRMQRRIRGCSSTPSHTKISSAFCYPSRRQTFSWRLECAAATLVHTSVPDMSSRLHWRIARLFRSPPSLQARPGSPEQQNWQITTGGPSCLLPKMSQITLVSTYSQLAHQLASTDSYQGISCFQRTRTGAVRRGGL